jgi:hypothetical protein
MRRSGKRALIQMQFADEAPFDISGLTADGFSRSNEFSFEINAEVQEGVSGYNEKHGETIPIGQGAWSASITSFYNPANAEANAYLWQMFTRQNDPDYDWEYGQAYRLIVMPDGEDIDHEIWTLRNAILKNYVPGLNQDEVMTLAAEFSGGMWACELIDGTDVLTLADIPLTLDLHLLTL